MKTSLLTISLFLLASISFGAIDITTNTNYTSQFIQDDIIIHSGATLNITGNISMGVGISITIKDGGKLVGVNGVLSSLSGNPGYDDWAGIIVEETPTSSPSIDYGLYLSSFTIRNATIGVSSLALPGFHNRKMRFSHVDFLWNGQHFKVLNGMASEVDFYTYSKILITNCTFGNSNDNWPVHIVYAREFIVLDSRFEDGNTPQFQLHLREMVDGRINGCEFDGNGSSSSISYCLGYHGRNENNTISNNSFNLSPGKSRYGLDLGTFAMGTQNQLVVSNNTFFSNTYDSNTKGIYMGGQLDQNITIENNLVSKLGIGFYFYGLNQSTVEKNTISDCGSGMYFRGGNPNVKIECNAFTSTIHDIVIAQNASLESQNSGYDPMNTFSSVKSNTGNIVNNGTTYFYYNYKLNQPDIINGGTTNPYIILQYTSASKDCSGGKKRLANGTETVSAIKQFPNPASGRINYSLNGEEVSQLVIFNSYGQIVKHVILENESGTIEIGNLVSGIYICSYEGENGTVKRVKLIVK
ncbi:MAG: T9SS type A sorting domain-containing protein [Crocinitomicaceae bacterium]|nr:right-handed parallel beta-helix repeat-containing protein [Flavobacteriales bacterium]NQZ38249.1 T9SS type A sorting domain-containing protein [Crocinitomicaceae bacterium]